MSWLAETCPKKLGLDFLCKGEGFKYFGSEDKIKRSSAFCGTKYKRADFDELQNLKCMTNVIQEVL